MRRGAVWGSTQSWLNDGTCPTLKQSPSPDSCGHRSGRSWRPPDGVARIASGGIVAAHPVKRLKITVPFVPPKPNEFDSTTSMAIGRATLGT